MTSYGASELKTADGNCPVCRVQNPDSTAVPWLRNMLEGQSEFSIQRCRSCGFGWLSPRPTPDQLTKLYGKQYFDRYAGDGVADHVPPMTITDRLRVKIAWKADRGLTLQEEIEPLLLSSSCHLCDIGCGNGGLLAKLQSPERTLIGVEPDAAARERCQSAGVSVLPGNTESLPSEIGSNTQDVVVMSHVLEHCIDPIGALERAARILRPGGSMIVEVPNAESMGAASLGSTWFHADYGRHVNFFGERSLKAAAARVGLRGTRISFSNYVVQFTNKWIGAQQGNWDKQLRLGQIAPTPGRDSKNRAWLLLLRTAFSSRSARYSVVRMIATKP